MKLLPEINAWYQDAHEWLMGKPRVLVSGLLLLYAALAIYAAFRFPPEARIALLLWVILP